MSNTLRALQIFFCKMQNFFRNLRKFFYVKCTRRNQYVSLRKTRSPLQDWYVSLPVPPVDFRRNRYTYALLQGSQVSFLARAKTYCSYLEMGGDKRWQNPMWKKPVAASLLILDSNSRGAPWAHYNMHSHAENTIILVVNNSCFGTH